MNTFTRLGAALFPILIAAAFATAAPAPSARRPNVLFVSIDDLNDWIEPLGGHPQARTPNLSRLASQSVNFTRNYCPSPGCNPSRSAVMTGVHPATSGMYSNYQDWRKAIPDAVTMGEYFRYIDDSEELYDHESDPNEWRNLADDKQHAETKARLAGLIPDNPAPLRPETLIELQPHHIPPYLSKEDYQRRREHAPRPTKRK